MEKRLPLALFLSFLVLFVWMILFGPRPEEGQREVPGNAGTSDAGAAPERLSDPGEAAAPGVAEPRGPVTADTEERFETLRVGEGAADGEPAYWARFSNRGARLVELKLPTYYVQVDLTPEEKADPANWLPLVVSAETADGPTGSLLLLPGGPSARELAPAGLDRVLWTMRTLGDGRGVEFQYDQGTGVLFTKRIEFEPGTWHIRVTLELENRGELLGGSKAFTFQPAASVPPELGDRFYTEPRAVAAGGTLGDVDFDDKGAPGAKGTGELDIAGKILFAGAHNKFFAFLMRAAEGGDALGTMDGVPTWRAIEEVGTLEPRPLIATQVPLALALPASGGKNSYEYVVYAGPKEAGLIAADFEPHQELLDEDLSTFASIGKGLLAVLRFFHGILGNWGWAIIVLTICVRLVLFPLNRRSQTAMARYQKKMKRVQPKIEEAKERFKDDPQKQREAQARIMQEEGAFPPLGGCLPMFLQLPIFLGLFSALRTSFDLRQAPFAFWIHDLSRPDRLLELDLKLPLLPDIKYLNLLPILMVVLWILQQRGMPQPTDEQAARMQKIMMFMPIVFGLMLYNYAAGLSLYVMTSSGLGIFEQRVIKKLWPIDDTEVETKKRSGCGPFAGMMENLAEKQKEQMKRVQAMQEEQRRQQSKKGERRKKRK